MNLYEKYGDSNVVKKTSKQALVARVQRALKRDNQVLRASRSERDRLEFGDYYIVNLDNNTVQAWHIKLEDLARELGCLKPFEELAE